MTPGEIPETASVRKPLPVFGQETYASIPTEELVVFAVQFLHADGTPATLEEVVSVCFKLFPHGFSLKNYFYWPDSARVSLHLSNAKDKGYIKGNTTDGFIVKVAGRRIVKQVARTLGIPMPMPPQVEKSKPVEAELPPAPPEASVPQETKKPVKKKKKAAPAKKVSKPARKPAAKKAKPAGKASLKKVVAKKPKIKKKPASPKRRAAPKPKAQKKSIPRKPKAVKKTTVRTAKPRTRMPQPAPAGTRALKITAPMKRAERKVATVPAVSKEERIKAGKVVHMMERSDAYRQYRKFGAKARISEFDFRNMLFATMESSAETLKRNVALFKKYAGIQNRTDLIAFLDYAEGNFAPLLKPSKQPARKK